MAYLIIIIFACVVAFVLSLINLIYYAKARAMDGDDTDPQNPSSGLTKTEATNMIIINSLIMILTIFIVFMVIRNWDDIKEPMASISPSEAEVSNAAVAESNAAVAKVNAKADAVMGRIEKFGSSQYEDLSTKEDFVDQYLL